MPGNGMRCVSLFSGGGGSDVGTELAGFETVYASEFIPAARATYLRNFPNVFLDSRDVRDVKPEEILSRFAMRPGDLDLLTGSPPCAGFSELVRKNTRRQDRWGKENEYSGTKQRTDDLFVELLRIVEGLRPKAVIAENVESMVEGEARGFFVETMRRFREIGYDAKAAVVDARWLGVAQSRKRLFIVAYRNDLGISPSFPKPIRKELKLKEALAGLPRDPLGEAECSFVGMAIEKVWMGLLRGQHRSDKYFGLYRSHWDRPANALTAASGKIGGASISHPDFPRKFTVPELKRICSFPDDFVLEGTYQEQVERLGRAVPPAVMRAVAEIVARDLAASGKACPDGPSTTTR